MVNGNTEIVSNHDELKMLQKEYLRTSKKLHKIQGRRKNDLERHLDDLKIELGWAYLDCKEYEKGLVLYHSLSWKTKGEEKCNGMARALTEMGYYDEAKRILDKGLRAFPDSYPLWVALGAYHESLGDDLESLRCFEIASQFAPRENSDSLYNKVLILKKLGSLRDAVALLNELIEKHPEDPKYLAERGCCALEMGYPREALPYYQRAMEIWQQSPTVYAGICIYTGLCTAYMDLGMKREAMEIALEGLKRFPDEESILYHNVGTTFWEMGWRNEAREVLTKGVEKFPEDEEMRKFLKDLEDSLDDPDNGEKPPILGLILLMALLYKRLKKK